MDYTPSKAALALRDKLNDCLHVMDTNGAVRYASLYVTELEKDPNLDPMFAVSTYHLLKDFYEEACEDDERIRLLKLLVFKYSDLVSNLDLYDDFFDLAFEYTLNDDEDKAIEIYKKGIEWLDKNHDFRLARMFCLLASTYRYKGDYKNAQKYCDEGLELGVYQGDSLFELKLLNANLMVNTGKPIKALKEYEMLLEDANDNEQYIDVETHQYMTLLLIGRKDDAIEVIHNMMYQLDPVNAKKFKYMVEGVDGDSDKMEDDDKFSTLVQIAIDMDENEMYDVQKEVCDVALKYIEDNPEDYDEIDVMFLYYYLSKYYNRTKDFLNAKKYNNKLIPWMESQELTDDYEEIYQEAKFLREQLRKASKLIPFN